MRKRDVFIVALSLLGLLVSFQHEGALSIRRGFLVPIYDEASKLRALPPPVITDLDGDGKNEVLLLTTRETLTLVNPAQIRRSHFDFTELHAKLEAAFISNCIGFAAGYTEKYNATRPDARKQIVVAVTDDYTVFAYDHQLQMLWSERLPDQNEGLFAPAHASVLVLPHDIHAEDRGLVVVGVDTRNRASPDAHSGGDRKIHFSYYALDGATGDLRWKHDASSFHDLDAAKTYPQQSYKLTTQHLEHHSGEQDWTVYRRSMLATFPHAHAHPHDTRLAVHHFGKKPDAAELEQRKKQKKPTAAHKQGKPVRKPGDDNFGEFGDRLAGITGLVQERMRAPHARDDHTHVRHPNVVVAHLEQGIEVLHLYTGQPLCQFGPLKAGHTYDDVNGDTTVDTIHADVHTPPPRRKKLVAAPPPPACVGTIDSGSLGLAHENMWNGRCYVPRCIVMGNNGICVHEGVLRHFEVLKELLREGEHQTDSEEEPTAFEGWGATDHFDHNTRSAMPLVLHHRVHEVSGLRRMHSTVLFYINSGLLTCVDPAAGRIVWQTETDSVFRGHNEREGATEALDQEDGGVSLRGTAPHDRATYHHYPHLVPFAVPASQFHQKTSKVGSGRSVLTTKDKPYVLVVGDNVLTAVKSATGKIEAEIDLDEAVIAPLVLGDFNSDGSKDIIAISRNAYYGFITYQQGGTSVLTFLMISVIGLLALLLISHRFMALSDPYFEPTFNSKRSTD